MQHIIDCIILPFHFLCFFNSPDDEEQSAARAAESIWLVAAVFSHLLVLFIHVFQNVGVLTQPAEREFFSSEDGSRAETTEGHQPSAK